MDNKELYDKYDVLVHATIVNIWSLATKRDHRLVLRNVDPSNKAHLYFVHCAFTAKDIAGMQVEVACGWIKYLWLKWKLRHSAQKVVKAPKLTWGMDPSDVLTFMEPLITEVGLGADFDWGDIYEAYYERKAETK